MWVLFLVWGLCDNPLYSRNHLYIVTKQSHLNAKWYCGGTKTIIIKQSWVLNEHIYLFLTYNACFILGIGCPPISHRCWLIFRWCGAFVFKRKG